MPEPLTDEELARIEAYCQAPTFGSGDLLHQICTDLPRVVATVRELREAAGPIATEAPGPTQGLDSIGDGAKVELWLEIQGMMVRFGEFTLGDLRRLAACVPERGE